MPRIHNQQGRYDDGLHRSRRGIRDRRRVTFLIPQEEISPDPTLSFPSSESSIDEQRGSFAARTTDRPTSSSSRFTASLPRIRTSIPASRSGMLRPDTPRFAPTSLVDPDHHETWTPRVDGLFPLTTTATPRASTQLHFPQEQPADYSESALPAMPHRVVLDDTLTGVFNLRWDIRDHISRARDRYDQPLDLEREAGLPTRVKLAVIEFESREHTWLVKRWGPIIVNNQFTAITFGDILSSISGYLRETIRDGEGEELIRTREDKERIDLAWRARHENTFHRVHHDVPGVYRRLDLIGGEMHFEKISLRWIGEWACHLHLTLMN